MKKSLFAVIAALGMGFFGLMQSAHAGVLLLVDLSSTNQITITATGGLSDVTISGSDTIGIYLDDFFADSSVGNFSIGATGDLSSFLNPSDGSASAFRYSSDTGDGLNIWSFTNDSMLDFTAGVQAFSGSITWDVSAAIYASALAGAFGGSIFFPADDANDLANAVILGTWARVDSSTVPLPAAVWLFAAGLGGLGVAKRKKAKV